MLADAAKADLAELRMVQSVQAAFPVGTKVRFYFDRNRVRHCVYGTVIAHGGTGYYAGHVVINNDATGKARSAYAPGHVKRGELELA
jgi:hypothetical protein